MVPRNGCIANLKNEVGNPKSAALQSFFLYFPLSYLILIFNRKGRRGGKRGTPKTEVCLDGKLASFGRFIAVSFETGETAKKLALAPPMAHRASPP